MRKSQMERYEIFDEKPMYKMKLFSGVESKVKRKLHQDRQNLQSRQQNSRPCNNYNNDNCDSNLDNIINKVENEIREMN